MSRGIDISEHQGTINLANIKSSVDFVILRIGRTGYGKSKSKAYDKYFERNYKLCKELGIPVGGYWYSCATSEAEAKQEAYMVLDAIEGKTFEYPIYFDTEDNHDIKTYAPVSQYSIGKQALTNIAKIWLETIESKGWYVGIYASSSWLKNQLDMSQLKAYDVWVAHYGVSKPSYTGSYGMWQFTSEGRVSGYYGDLDMNMSYKDYPSIMKKAKLNGYGNRNGEVDGMWYESDELVKASKGQLKYVDGGKRLVDDTGKVVQSLKVVSGYVK